ncbi:hypothetical protein H4582DRAFT_1929125 [Lactarius indigo]|nr:hypothetical protein H4582DRAFT_1929125 [Lactarius indigo]
MPRALEPAALAFLNTIACLPDGCASAIQRQAESATFAGACRTRDSPSYAIPLVIGKEMVLGMARKSAATSTLNQTWNVRGPLDERIFFPDWWE